MLDKGQTMVKIALYIIKPALYNQVSTANKHNH